ncbi:hypothetical protein EUX98_g1833 [Antrodiella citrinella]|uniref:GH16 domain-containing protein n=1 Tax=Antrodiella citrinella TaxID=2447956 RepID=A0A4S4N3C1_9APHY|nr:hypothetical protein EUX98_g1833 [Antrodiella citrinella]
MGGPNPFDTPTSSVYIPSPGLVTPATPGLIAGDRTSIGSRPPPSAFLPFQSHPGNPDPGMSIPGIGRRSSLESLARPSSATGVYANATGYSVLRNGSEVGMGASTSQVSLERPYAPFRDASGDGSMTPPSPNTSQSNIYRNSAAGALAGNAEPGVIPRTLSSPQIAMRAPFLSPASRPNSIWSPPSHPYPPSLHSPPSLSYLPTGAYISKPTKTKTLMPSTRLSSKLTIEDKPWIGTRLPRSRLSYFLTLFCFFLGIAAGAVVCFLGWTNVKMLSDADLCPVMFDDFDSTSLNTGTWNVDAQLGGFGNGEFQITTAEGQGNLMLQNGELWILPSLTSDEIGRDKIIDGGTYTVQGCSVQSNKTACTASSNKLTGQVIPPVKAARINTQGHANIQFGKVEVRAKLPKGDWLWPAIWMLPENDTIYGPWPMGGEMDIMEARGNDITYPAQGLDFVRSSLNYGVFDTLQTHLLGWWASAKRTPYNLDFHTYSMEWTPDWMRFYVDSRLQATMNMKITGKHSKTFFERGAYPKTVDNGNGTDVVVQNIWSSGSNAAPFDQSFYLILDLAAGGTSGWFPDGVGGKPWFDDSATAMHDFAATQDTWHATWATNQNDLAFRIDSVKMWKLKDGTC